MIMTARWAVAAAMGVSLLCGGCASSQKSDRPQTVVFASEMLSTRITRGATPVSGFYRAAPDSVWLAIPAAFKDLAFPRGTQTNGAEQLFVTQEMTIQHQLYDNEPNSLYFDCGRTPAGNAAADEYAVSFTIFARVVPDGDRFSHVDVLVDGRAHDRTRNNMSAVFCNGKGRLEQMVIDAIRKRLAL
ncbi:MAG TPA: hypothetical protein VKH19_11480 [Gemmatimonadaceae bacterium]|nr:hypothetical protein [Gemmatimonadaceae bacterium]